jgi:DNA-directed RNA polymerase specialized sigma24 family protein
MRRGKSTVEEKTLATEMLPFATRVALRTWHDPEAESLAGAALLHALRTYDGRIPLRRWVARCVKLWIWHYWRKMKVREPWSRTAEEGAFEYAACEHEFYVDEGPLSDEEWQILCERYVDAWAEDVIARRRDMTVYRVRKVIAEATRKLEEFVRN